MAQQKTKTPAKTENVEKEFVIPLRGRFRQVPRYKRTNKAVKSIKEYIVRHMKIYDRDLKKVKIDKNLNEFLWHRGIKNPPFKVRVKANKNKDGNVSVELLEMPEKLKFKKARLEKREAQAKAIMEEKKTRMQKMKESAKGVTTPGTSTSPKQSEEKEEKNPEEKKKEDEKKKAVIEAGKEMKKQAAKQAKHQTKQAKSKKPKRPKRQAMQK